MGFKLFVSSRALVLKLHKRFEGLRAMNPPLGRAQRRGRAGASPLNLGGKGRGSDPCPGTVVTEQVWQHSPQAVCGSLGLLREQLRTRCSQVLRSFQAGQVWELQEGAGGMDGWIVEFSTAGQQLLFSGLTQSCI